jgi:hypothetical protein
MMCHGQGHHLMKIHVSLCEQNVSDLIDLTTSAREQKASEVAFAKELEVRREAFQAGR